MTLTKADFRDFICDYKSLPREILTDYGFISSDELPSDNHKLAFINLEAWYRDMEGCLRYLLLNDNEYKKEYIYGSLKAYQPFAIEKQKYFELIKAIINSEFGKKNYPLPEHWKYGKGRTLFYVSELQTCEDIMRGFGILGTEPSRFISKAWLHKTSKFLYDYFNYDKPNGIFQKTNTGKLVDVNTLKFSELDITKFKLMDSPNLKQDDYSQYYQVRDPEYSSPK